MTITVRRRLNSLIAFKYLNEVPFNAQITNAELTLWPWQILNGGGTVTLYQVAPSASGASWSEGNADATDTEFIGTTSTSIAANWNYRQSISHPWTTPGGDTIGLLLQSKSITGGGSQVFASPNLTAAVQGIVDAGVDDPYAADDGFILYGPYGPFLLSDTAVRFASGDYPNATYRPTLRIDYTPTEPYSDSRINEDSIQTAVMPFVSEGENMRWIYDLDDDNIFETDIGGVCEIHADYQNYLPYTYAYTGAPSYTGVDCCAWQIDSPQTGTVGTGQALFFHNLDPAIPSNVPPDTDGDGILDNCDNCLDVPNGPFLGTCRSATAVGGTCHSNADCATGEVCDQSQTDSDENFVGDVCDVPEPGFAVGLASGIALIVGLRRRRLV